MNEQNELARLVCEALSLVRDPDSDPSAPRALDELTRAKVDQLTEIGDRAYPLAVRLGLDRHFPQVSELDPEVDGCELGLGRCQFVSRFHLPGDWDRVVTAVPGPLRPTYGPAGKPPAVPLPLFLPAPPRGWFRAMETLRQLALAAPAVASADARPEPAPVPVVEHRPLPPWEDPERMWDPPEQEQTRRLLEFMFPTNKGADIAELGEHMWGDSAPEPNRLKQALHRANAYLLDHCKKQLRKRGTRIVWG